MSSSSAGTPGPPEQQQPSTSGTNNNSLNVQVGNPGPPGTMMSPVSFGGILDLEYWLGWFLKNTVLKSWEFGTLNSGVLRELVFKLEYGVSAVTRLDPKSVWMNP